MASLKDQLTQAGYDTSTLDESAVLKQLSDAGYDVSSFTAAPNLMGDLTSSSENANVTNQGDKTHIEPFYTAGKGVEAGYSGVGSLVGGNGLPQASQDVQNVMSGLAPETTSGKVGKFFGSFFTPSQIAMTATGEAAAKPIVEGLSAGANKVGELLAPASESELPGAAKAVGNALSTVSGVGTPELETVMVNPEAVGAAGTFPQLAENVAGSMNKLTEHIGDLEKAANATLDAGSKVDVQPMVDAINQEIKAINMADVTTPSMDSAKNVLEGMLAKIKDKGTMSEPEMAKWVKNVQGRINWNDPLGTDLNEALTHVQSTVNDALKEANPDYATATENFANAVNLKNDLMKAMGMSRESGAFTPENVSVAKLKGLLSPDSALQTKKLLGEFSEVPGVPNYTDLAKQTAAKAALQQGWRARLAGLMAGNVPGALNLAKTTLSGGLTALPSAANAVAQGLTQ